MSSPEVAVRSYLQWLEDPDSVRDHAAIAEAKESAANAADPLDRLRALSALQELEAVDGEAFRAAFVANAGLWAQDNGVTPEAFASLGVANDVLADAGLIEPRRAAASASPRKRRTRISPEVVKAAIPDGSFTIAQLEEASGASTATVRKVIAEMTEAGTLRDLGPDQTHTGRGRAPLLFTT